MLALMRPAVRFIPACAGNTTAPREPRRRAPVHPRVRGEHSNGSVFLPPSTGSSPRARGTLPPIRHIDTRWRFIPACAGNTTPFAAPSPSIPVHPRVRGEHHPYRNATHLPCGSSPRARGTHYRECLRSVRARFIPACAGNTEAGGTKQRRESVHPRVRGEHAVAVPCVVVGAGSSPRARGTRRGKRVRRTAVRFIPACAGNTA